MIISNNRSPNHNEFETLVESATKMLNADAEIRADYYSERHAQLLEDDVLDALKKSAYGTNFLPESIVKISGQKFQDIVAEKYYGVEVKTSKDNWLSIGGSVNESTRSPDVERIFLTFGKLSYPVEFISKTYEACLYDIAVTHSPRYRINMKLKEGETIFDQMRTTYDEMRSDNPIGKFVDYYNQQKLNDEERLWWTGKNLSEELSDIRESKIVLWGNLEQTKQKQLKAQGIALFPKILSDSRQGYKQFTLWLTTIHNVVSPSLRDSFSAGGKAVIEGMEDYGKLPRILVNINTFKTEILEFINTADASELCNTWGIEELNEDRLKVWIESMPESYKFGNDKDSTPVLEIVRKIFSK